MRRLVIVVAIALPAVLAPVTPSAAATGAPKPFQHIVVIVEQNATFDHLFGSLPFTKGIGAGTRLKTPQRGADNPIVMRDVGSIGTVPFAVKRGEEVLSNGPIAARTAFNDGRMNGFYQAQVDAGKDPTASFTVQDPGKPSLWSRLGNQGVVFDRYFSSTLGGSLPNTLNLVAGTSGGITDSSRSSLRQLWRSDDITTIFDAAGGTSTVSWRYYVGGLDQLDQSKLADGSYARSREPAPSQLYWAPILAMERFWTNPAFTANVRPQNDFFSDAAQGILPSISYLLPQPTTHAPRPLQPNLRLLSTINALRASPNWSSTAVLVVWDDWGGYYDDVPPPEVRGQQLGFRVPMLLLSPQADAGEVSHRVLDHSSIPAFIASNFGLTEYSNRGRTRFPGSAWSDTMNPEDRVVALTHPSHYEAAGMAHAPSVFILYLLTVVMITGVLFVVGVTLRGTPNEGGNEP